MNSHIKMSKKEHTKTQLELELEKECKVSHYYMYGD